MPKAQLEDGYTKIANQIIEKMLVVNLSPYETRVLMCIIRKTYGWGKKEDWISNSQIVKETNIYKAHVSRAVSKLKFRNIVTQTGNKLSINTTTSSWLPELVTRNELPKRVTIVTQTGISKLPKRVDTKETITKETIQKKRLPIKDDLEKIDIKGIALAYKVPESFVLSCWDDVMNYCYGHGKKYSDWSAVLRNFVKGGAIKINKEVHGKSTIGFIKTE